MKTDLQIQKDVMDELLWEPSVHAAEIGVEVKNGIVTLSGHVRSFSEKHLAEKVAQRVAGVRALACDLDVTLPNADRRTDAEIAQSAVNALAWNTSVPTDKIKISVEDNWVTLSGETEWAYQRAAAERALRYLRGVTGISNNIKLKPRVVPADLEKKIEAALRRQAQREAHNIHFSIAQGEVTLSGVVHSLAERVAAEGAVWGAPGVTAVIDNIVVR